MLMAFTWHVTECSQRPCKVSISNQYFIDTLISSNEDTTTHTELLRWEFNKIHRMLSLHSAEGWRHKGSINDSCWCSCCFVLVTDEEIEAQWFTVTAPSYEMWRNWDWTQCVLFLL